MSLGNDVKKRLSRDGTTGLGTQQHTTMLNSRMNEEGANVNVLIRGGTEYSSVASLAVRGHFCELHLTWDRQVRLT